jgi:hypothetical protein
MPLSAKADTTKDTTQGGGQNSAVINPYALAELVAGRKIPWKDLPDPTSILEQLLGTPYEELFDPKYSVPLYIGTRLDENFNLVPERSPLLDITAPTEGNDATIGGLTEIGQFATLGDLIKNGNFADIIKWPIACVDLSRISKVSISLQLPQTLRNLQLGDALSLQVIKSITFDPNLIKIYLDTGWTPPGGHWATAGEFFH